MVSHLDFETGLQHLTDQPGQQAALTGEFHTVGSGLSHQRFSPLRHVPSR